MTLSEFLLARIAEDEAAARLGAGEPAYLHYGDTAAEEATAMADREGCSADGTDHLNRWMPPRVLAECEAKRRIVGHCRHDDWTDPRTVSLGEPGEGQLGDVLALLALPYADHEDYRQDWRSWRSSTAEERLEREDEAQREWAAEHPIERDDDGNWRRR